MDIAVKELQSIISPDEKKEVTPNLIMDVVCDHFSITKEQIVSKNRSNDIAKPRQIIMYLCKNMTGYSLDAIGSLLGGRDHTTVLHGVQTISKEYNNNENIRNTIDTIRNKINPN